VNGNEYRRLSRLLVAAWKHREILYLLEGSDLGESVVFGRDRRDGPAEVILDDGTTASFPYFDESEARAIVEANTKAGRDSMLEAVRAALAAKHLAPGSRFAGWGPTAA
jgi:hypothetical protein